MRRTHAFLLSAVLLAACQPAGNAPADEAASSSSSDAAVLEDHAAMEGSSFSRSSVTVDKENSTVTFVGGSSIVDHPGTFETFDATVTLDPATPQDLSKAVIAATIDVTSVKTDTERLDAHFQREDFFDTANFPTASFRSTIVRHVEGDRYSVTGNLTMKGVTKTVSVDAEITDDGLSAEFAVPRKDFGIANDTYGQKLLDELVPVTVELAFE